MHKYMYNIYTNILYVHRIDLGSQVVNSHDEIVGRADQHRVPVPA